MVAQIHRGAVKLAEILAGTAVLGLLILALATGGDVFMRFVFASPIRGFTDISAVVAAVLLAACLPYVVAIRGNIAVYALGSALGPRVKRALNFFGALVTCLFFAAMAWQCTMYAIDMFNAGETMPTLRWPVWPWWSAVAVFISLTALVALATLTEISSDS